MSGIRVMLADDHTILRQGIRAILEAHADIQVIGEASDGRETVTKALALKPDVILMDIAMPSMTGLEATRQIKQQSPQTKILILTMHENEEYILQILQSGGSGYVLKRAAASELVHAIRAVYQGDFFLHPAITKALVSDYLKRVQSGQEVTSYDRLTDREREILKLIAEGNTNKEIAELLSLSIKTVEAHRVHIMEKLGLHSRVDLVKYAIRTGLIDIHS
ncbi:MAG: response regulator transcription factor [Chloroflexota bacterium]|nr:MAG: response regulator transcription factor [Chloroflexota bacterium]